MSNYRLSLDEKRCITCKACEAICKVIHDTVPGISLGRLLTDGPQVIASFPGTTETDNNPQVVLHAHFRACLHCPKPHCVESCPSGALMRREKDGLVLVREYDCTGCGSCQEACPHHLLWTDPRNGKTVKCDFCYERLDEGLQPACVTVCPTQALWVLDLKNKSI